MSEVMWGLHMAGLQASAPVDGNFVAIGWYDMGDLSILPATREAFKTHFSEVYPSESPGALPAKAGVLYRFTHEINVGAIVVYPSKPDRIVHVGIVEGDYTYLPDVDDEYAHRRAVKWVKSLPRTSFSQSALYEIGSAITLFQITTHADEFRAAIEGNPTGAEDIDEDTVNEVSIQMEESAEDFIIKQLKTKLSSYQFEKFIAHLLTCMGYHARVTQRSSDGGIDVIAHRDELGFEPPIIKVQCKQTLDQIGRPSVQALQGAVAHGEHGLFITLGAFSNDARNEERVRPNLRLIDGNALIELIYTYYENFEPKYKMLLPLKRTYIPASILAIED